MRALITRPREVMEPLASALIARGIEVIADPLLSIRFLPGPEIDFSAIQAILVTSANGAIALAQRTKRRDIRLLAVGEGSAAAARKEGFLHVESAAGDVESLCNLVKRRLRPEEGGLFHAAGSILAGDLKGLLEQAGFSVTRLPLYEALEKKHFEPETSALLKNNGLDCVLFFSPRTALIFRRLWIAEGKPNLRTTAALCLSRAIANKFSDLEWKKIAIAAKPDLPSMLMLVDAERKGDER